jgi:hypothetical protein
MTVDELAQIIRRVDGNHSLGAGELAEAILAALSPPIMAWMTADGRIATDETKRTAMASPSRAAFNIPLFAGATQPEAYGVRAGLSAEDRNRAIVAGIETSERLHAVDHTFSPAYLGMAIAQDAIRALSHTEQGETKP